MKPNRGREQREPVLVGIEAIDDLNTDLRRALGAVGPSNSEKASQKLLLNLFRAAFKTWVDSNGR